MKGITKQTLAALAAMAIIPVMPAMANAGLCKVTVAQDTPYRQIGGKTVAVKSLSSEKFQIAPVKMQNAAPAAATPAPAPTANVRPHWR